MTPTPPQPGAAGASSTPLQRKLGVAAGARVAISAGPADLGTRLGDAVITSRLGGEVEVIVAFFTTRRALERQLPRPRQARAPRGSRESLRPAPAIMPAVAALYDSPAMRELDICPGGTATTELMPAATRAGR